MLVLWDFLFWYPWLPFPELWAGLWFVCYVPKVWAWFLFGRFACWHVCGVWFWFVSPFPRAWACMYLVGLPVGIWLCL